MENIFNDFKNYEKSRMEAYKDVNSLFELDSIDKQLESLGEFKALSICLCKMLDDIDVSKINREQRICRTSLMPSFIYNELNIDYIIKLINENNANLKDIDVNYFNNANNTSLFSLVVDMVTGIKFCTMIFNETFDENKRYGVEDD